VKENPTHFHFRLPWSLRQEAEKHLREEETLAAYILRAVRELNTRNVAETGEPWAVARRKFAEGLEILDKCKPGSVQAPAPVVVDSSKPLFVESDLMSIHHPRFEALVEEIKGVAVEFVRVYQCADWAIWKDAQMKSPFRWLTLRDVLTHSRGTHKAKVEAMLELEPGVAALLRGSGAEAAEM
jgi:hypothetical protein